MKPVLHPVQRDANSRVHLIVGVGHKWLSCVILDRPIRVVQLPIADHGLHTLKHEGKPYPLKRAIRLFRHFSKFHMGITDGAKNALTELKEGT